MMKFSVTLKCKADANTVSLLIHANDSDEAHEKADAIKNEAMKHPDDWEIDNIEAMEDD
jgi:hypothetical protein